MKSGWRSWWCRLPVVGGALLLLAGCAANPVSEAAAEAAGATGASFGVGYPPGSAAWSDTARSAYRIAFLAGMQDQREGFRYDDDRGAQALDVEERGFYRQGYRRGYYHDANLRRVERQTGAEGEKIKESGSTDQTGGSGT